MCGNEKGDRFNSEAAVVNAWISLTTWGQPSIVMYVPQERRRRECRRVKGKVCKMSVRPDMIYGLETQAVTNRQGAEVFLFCFSCRLQHHH